YTAKPRLPMALGIAWIEAAMSRRKQADNFAATVDPMLIASRVFVRPGCGALHMIPIAVVMSPSQARGFTEAWLRYPLWANSGHCRQNGTACSMRVRYIALNAS